MLPSLHHPQQRMDVSPRVGPATFFYILLLNCFVNLIISYALQKNHEIDFEECLMHVRAALSAIFNRPMKQWNLDSRKDGKLDALTRG